MITPPDWAGVVFSDSGDGDLRSDISAREDFCRSLGIRHRWAAVHQVHGSRVVRAASSGELGDADAVWTTVPKLPVAVFTADCLGVVLMAEDAVGVAHAGWRGAADGVVAALFQAMARAGHEPGRAAVGPGIGPCCFEVGPEVVNRFHVATVTSWGAPSVDLVEQVRAQIPAEAIWISGYCTKHEPGWFSHRKDGETARMVALGWV